MAVTLIHTKTPSASGCDSRGNGSIVDTSRFRAGRFARTIGLVDGNSLDFSTEDGVLGIPRFELPALRGRESAAPAGRLARATWL